MIFSEILKKVEAGEITLDCYGHRVNDPLERLARHYHNLLDGANGGKDGQWNLREDETMEEINARMREHYQRHLDFNFEEGDEIFETPEVYCFKCGMNHHWVYDGDKLSLRCHFQRDDSKWGGKLVNVQDRCPLEKPSPMVTRITTSGTLVFTNFFRCEDCEKEDKYTEKWSINGLQGRMKIAEWKAKNQNIAYGQLSNMSFGVFVNEAGDSIIIGDPYVADSFLDNLTDEEYEEYEKNGPSYEKLSEIEGHKMIGSVCCDVWRWEASDKETLGPLYDELLNRDYKADRVEYKCQPGTWEVTHFFDLMREGIIEEGPVYSRMRLVK